MNGGKDNKMALNKKTEKKEEAKTYEIKVTRAKDFSKDGQTSIAIDMEVNGVMIYGAYYRTGTTKKGDEYRMIAFPSKKGNDGKYYNHVYFKITDEMLDQIEPQIDALL